MFCPLCGSTQNDELKFCKQCGANLHALRRVMSSRDESDEKFDWSKTWVAEMFMSGEEQVKREAAMERLRGITPETKRQNEIKAGVITGSVGVALMIFLYVFMQGLIASGAVSDIAAVILGRVWLAGVIPLFVGAALVFNGMVVSKKGTKKAVHDTTSPDVPNALKSPPTPAYLSPAETTNDLASSIPYSVTDETTKHLKQPR